MSRPLGVCAALLAVLLAAGCASMGEAFAPAANPWPTAKNGPVQRHGQTLRVYGASLKNRAEADVAAKKALELWLWRLPLGDNLQDRRRRIDSVLAVARPVVSPVPDYGYSSMIELELSVLQRMLGTDYE